MIVRNPILRGFNPDPSICRVGDDYYIATSTFEWYPGVQIHHSRDLAHWRLVTRPLDRAAQLDMRGNPDSCGVWAPALSYADGLFWLIYTNVRRYDGNYKDTPNYLVTAPAIDGPWSDPIYLNASGFDPSLFHDDDGRKWLVNMIWDHRDGRSFFGGIALQQYDPGLRRLTGPVRNIFRGSELGFTEAPHLFKRGDFYYLITAEGGTGYEHAVTHARSREIVGPYELHPAPHVLTAKDAGDSPLQRVGHGQFCQGPGDTIVHTFLCSRPLPGRYSPMGRETGIDLLQWDEHGWMHRLCGDQQDRVPREVLELESDTETSAAHPSAAFSEHSHFAPGELPMPFQWLRTPYPERIFSLSERPGWLRLWGRESIGSWFEQALVARRQTEYCCSAEVELDFDPQHFQQQAGLVAYYNRCQFYFAYVSRDDAGARRLRIQYCAGDWPQARLAFAPEDGIVIDEGSVFLGLDIDRDKLSFRYRGANSDWQILGPTLDATVLSDEGGRGEHANFTGNFIGMAAQDISGCAHHADFRNFTYQCRQA